jgi:Flp pilus assembly protein TadG
MKTDTHRMRAHDRKERTRGTGLLELAFLLPVFMILVAGVVDMGRYAQFNILVANAAHTGALYGSQNLVAASDTIGIQAAAINDAGTLSTPLQVSSQMLCGCAANSLSTTCPAACANALTYIQVTATGTFHSVFTSLGLPTSVSKMAQIRVSE